jgi:hypothetical protein
MELAREKMRRTVINMVQMAGQLRHLDGGDIQKSIDTITKGVVGFTATGAAVTWEDCEAIEGARRGAMNNHGSAVTWPREHLYKGYEEGGQGSAHAYQVAVAGWLCAIDNAIAAPKGQPVGVLARHLLAATAWRLGCRGVSPLEWHPQHLAEHLSEDIIIEAWYKARLRAGLRGVRTAQEMSDGLEDGKWIIGAKEEMQRGPREWERSPLRWWKAAKPCAYEN